MKLKIKMPGSCGEFVQGFFNGEPILITCPIEKFSTVTVSDEFSGVEGLGEKALAMLKKFGDFKLHCMMDEIGKLHPDNVVGILKFANVRNVYLINSSPTTYNAQAYKYTYSLSKDYKSNTVVKTLLTIR